MRCDIVVGLISHSHFDVIANQHNLCNNGLIQLTMTANDRIIHNNGIADYRIFSYSNTASDYGIIPAGADAFSLQALEQIHDTAQAVQKYTNKELQIMGVLICRYSGRSILSRELAEMIGDKAQEIGTMLFNTRIRENISIKEAQQMQQDIFTYAPRSNGAVDYRNFVQEVLSYGNKENI